MTFSCPVVRSVVRTSKTPNGWNTGIAQRRAGDVGDSGVGVETSGKSSVL